MGRSAAEPVRRHDDDQMRSRAGACKARRRSNIVLSDFVMARSYASPAAGSRLPRDCQKLTGGAFDRFLHEKDAIVQGLWRKLRDTYGCAVRHHEPDARPGNGLCATADASGASSTGCSSGRTPCRSRQRASGAHRSIPRSHDFDLLCQQLLYRCDACGGRRTGRHSLSAPAARASPGGCGRVRRYPAQRPASPSPSLIGS